jgi:hypothetical protein
LRSSSIFWSDLFETVKPHPGGFHCRTASLTHHCWRRVTAVWESWSGDRTSGFH